MNLKNLTQLFSLRDLRNAALGVGVVFGGLALTALTLYAHRTGDVQLAGIAAGISLIFVLLILVFVVPPLARNAGREAAQMNLPFEFTTGGAVMIVLIVVVGFSAWNTGNNLLFLVLSFLIAAMIVGFFAGRIVLQKLDVKMRFPESIFAGEPTPVTVSLGNRKRLFPAISVVADVRGKEREKSIVADELHAILPGFIAKRLGRPPTVRRTLGHFAFVPKRGTEENKVEYTFPNRGHFLIKNFELSTRFPFGFFRHRRRLPARETELIIFPKITPFSAAHAEIPLDAGRLTSAKRGVGQDLLALRDYQTNDDLRRVDWKATARSRQLTVREFAAEDERRVTVIFDRLLEHFGGEKLPLREKLAAEQNGQPVVISERFESGAAVAASILAHFSDERAEFRLLIDGNGSEFGSGRAHLYDCLKRLALVEPAKNITEPESQFERISSQRGDSHTFYVTANDTETLPADIVHSLKIIRF
ncbi:MAG: DUF58 domain-containing protein [Pyrinomonadaceae bacterium]|nr:DUF58 domain-containing protein [Acidobacteriota bacterium]MBK7932049.1 DUF58 domain-containing protein [Acidobacteriota bacterium]MBP7375797.1 DUF58 domain-containing protein [Pyrinomonadaceae bacterium]